MRTYLSDIESKFQSGDLSVTNFNSDALQDIASYNSIMDSIYNKETADIELNADTIEGMSLDDIEKAKNKTLEGLSDEGKSILKFAFNDLKNGHITKQEYLNILKGLQKIDNISDLENTEEELNITFIEYFIDNYKNIGINLWSDVMVALVKEWGKVSGEIGIVFNELGASIRDIGRAINKFGFKLTNKIHSFFNTVGKSLNTVGKGFSRFGKFIHGVGQAAGIGTMAAGFLIGMDDDLSNKGKTGGEAFLHNATSLGVGLITNHAGTLATRLAVPFLLGSNPGGWAVLGGIALGTVVTTGFNYAYDINFLGIQDGLDAAGQALDRTYNRAKDAVSSVVDSAGEAIKGGLDAINPMNWGWG
jgi:hypothetical protein